MVVVIVCVSRLANPSCVATCQLRREDIECKPTIVALRQKSKDLARFVQVAIPLLTAQNLLELKAANTASLMEVQSLKGFARPSEALGCESSEAGDPGGGGHTSA